MKALRPLPITRHNGRRSRGCELGLGVSQCTDLFALAPEKSKLNYLATSLSTGLIRERELEGHAILRAHNFRDVIFASSIFDKINVPRPDGNLFPSRNFDLSPAAQRDHMSAAWGAMPIVNTTTRRSMERGPSDLQHLGDFSRAAGSELQFCFFGMRLIVRTRVEPCHEYGLWV